MTALAANLQVFELREGWQIEAPVLAAEIIYKGSPVFMNSSGRAYAPDGTTNTPVVGDTFLGFAYEKVDNSGGAAEDKDVRIVSRGIVKMPLAGTPTQAKVGQPVFYNVVGDDATLTLTNDLTAIACNVGIFIEYIDSSNGYVMIDGACGKKCGYGISQAIANDEGFSDLKLAKFTYSFAVDGGAVGSITLGTIPSGVIVLAGVVDVRTALTGSGTGALQLEGANDLITAASFGGAPWSTTGRKAFGSNVNFGTSTVKTTASRALTFAIASDTCTAGIFDAFLLLANL